MMGFLGTSASNLVGANMLLQIVIFILIVGAVKSAKDGNYRRHGLLTGIAILLGFVSLILVMGPTFVGSFRGIVYLEYGLGSIVVLTHAIIGAVALIMGVIALLTLRP